MASMAMEFLPRPARQWVRRGRRSLWKGLVAGAAGGLVGTIAMTQFQKAWQKTAEKKQLGDGRRQRENWSQQRAQERQEEQQHEEREDATMKAAGKLARLAGTELTREQRGTASPFIHYGFGTAMGALWGLAMETSPRAIRKQRSPFFGSIFGSGLFLGADEVAVPALGLGEAGEKPASHLYAWASHLVYGMTAEFVRRQVRERL